MTDTNTPNPADADTEADAPDAPDAQQDTNETSDDDSTHEDAAQGADDDQLRKARKEAANYRERLRATEAERDAHTTTIDALRRQIIDADVTRAGLKPAALWAAGYDVADLIDSTGHVNAEALADAIAHTRETLGISPFHGSADQGTKGRTAAAPAPTPSWSNMLRPQQ